MAGEAGDCVPAVLSLTYTWPTTGDDREASADAVVAARASTSRQLAASKRLETRMCVGSSRSIEWTEWWLQVERHGAGGCPIGSLVGQLAENDEDARLALAGAFDHWEARLRDGLSAMQGSGKLDRRADTLELATATLAAIQGGLLLTQANRDPGQLAIALDAAYAHLRAHAATARR